PLVTGVQTCALPISTSGETIMVPFVIMNRGNSEDAFQLTSTLPPSFQPVFFHDVEGTGQVRTEEPSVTETPRLGIGQKARFVLQIGRASCRERVRCE